MEDIEDEIEDQLPVKVILVGESGVGKTSIINQYISNEFSENIYSTSNASYVNKTIYLEDNKKLNLAIWDTAGQEKFRSLAKIFYKDANIIILVYDITSYKSFQELKNFWYEQTKLYSNNSNNNKNIVLCICGNKYDLYENEQVNEDEVKNFCNQINALFFTVSAKNSFGIEDCFKNICRKYLDPNFHIEYKKNENNNEEIEQTKSIILNEKTITQGEIKKKKKCCK